MSSLTLVNLSLFSSMLVFLFFQQKKGYSLSRLVLTGLLMGGVFGFILQSFYINQPHIISRTLEWTHVISQGYIELLQMVIMPLVLISMISAIVKLENLETLGKVSSVLITVLLTTTAISALVGIGVACLFDLTAEGLTQNARETATMAILNTQLNDVKELTLPTMLISFIPANPFADLARSRPTSIIAIVIFGILLGIATRKVMQEATEKLKASIHVFIISAQSIIMRLVKMVIGITPYGIAALMTKVVATSNLQDIIELISFILASYTAILSMFLIHGFLLSFVGVSPKMYFTKIWPVLTFAFSSRSSAATIPLNIQTQVEKLNVSPAIANLSATFGSTIGQNGCAGIYPAMLAVMTAPIMDIDPTNLQFILSLIGIIIISSFGIAGIGGGATFAALVVLPAMGLPITIVALLISIEPLIDMARTALNVSGAMVTGTITDRLLKSRKN